MTAMSGRSRIITLDQPPGFSRDSTIFGADRSVDGQHVRWHEGRIRKQGGFLAGSVTLTGVVRATNLYSLLGESVIHSMSSGKIERIKIAADFTTAAVVDRTPVGFVVDANNNWQSTSMFDEGSITDFVIVHATENLLSPSKGTQRDIYVGDATGIGVFTQAGKTVDGGVVALQPYLVGYGSAGYVAWSDVGLPTAWAGGDAGDDRVTGAKIVRGMPIRNAGSGPAGLLWSLDSLILMQYVGGAAIWAFQHLSKQITVLSTNGMIEFEGRFYWPGLDQFYVYDGTVRTLENTLNANWFFDGLNYTYQQKVWATINRRFGEIWWFYPRGEATECSHAIILNVRETERLGRPIWYDTALARSAGNPPQVLRYPIWVDTANPAHFYFHEYGLDNQTAVGAKTAISSYIETGPFSMQINDQGGVNNWTKLTKIEPDMDQAGTIAVTVATREYARSPDVNNPNNPAGTGIDYSFTATDTTLDLIEHGRQMRLRFTSNVVGGDYETGRMLLHIEPGDTQ